MKKLLIILVALGSFSAFASESIKLASEMASVLGAQEIQQYIDQTTPEVDGNVSTYFLGISLSSLQLQCKGATNFDLNFETVTIKPGEGVESKKCSSTVQVGECQFGGQYTLGEGPKEIKLVSDRLNCN